MKGMIKDVSVHLVLGYQSSLLLFVYILAFPSPLSFSMMVLPTNTVATTLHAVCVCTTQCVLVVTTTVVVYVFYTSSCATI